MTCSKTRTCFAKLVNKTLLFLFYEKREEARRFLTDVDLATMQIPTNLKWMEPLLDFFVFIEGEVFFCFCFFCYRPSPENLKWKLSRLFIFWS
jgi:hypothetical protein